jgi:mono/diheme cytochrome c family protein
MKTRGHLVTVSIAVVAIVVVAAASAVIAQRSRIHDLTTKNATLAAGKSEAMQQRDAAQHALDERAAQMAAAAAEAKRIEALRPPGATLFAANCASCHGSTGGGRIGPQLSGGVVARDFSEEQAVAFVTSGGIAPMPTFGTVLSPAQIKQVVAYVRSL